jgi:hypothetical protein
MNRPAVPAIWLMGKRQNFWRKLIIGMAQETLGVFLFFRCCWDGGWNGGIEANVQHSTFI